MNEESLCMDMYNQEVIKRLTDKLYPQFTVESKEDNDIDKVMLKEMYTKLMVNSLPVFDSREAGETLETYAMYDISGHLLCEYFPNMLLAEEKNFFMKSNAMIKWFTDKSVLIDAILTLYGTPEVLISQIEDSMEIEVITNEVETTELSRYFTLLAEALEEIDVELIVEDWIISILPD